MTIQKRYPKDVVFNQSHILVTQLKNIIERREQNDVCGRFEPSSAACLVETNAKFVRCLSGIQISITSGLNWIQAIQLYILTSPQVYSRCVIGCN